MKTLSRLRVGQEISERKFRRRKVDGGRRTHDRKSIPLKDANLGAEFFPPEGCRMGGRRWKGAKRRTSDWGNGLMHTQKGTRLCESSISLSVLSSPYFFLSSFSCLILSLLTPISFVSSHLCFLFFFLLFLLEHHLLFYYSLYFFH